MRGVESLQIVERSLSKGTRKRELESVHLSQMEKEKICSEQRSLYDCLEKKLNELFKDNLQAELDIALY